MFIVSVIIFVSSVIFSTYIQLRIKQELKNNNYKVSLFNNRDFQNLLNLIRLENDLAKKKHYRELLTCQIIGIILSLIGFSLVICSH